MPRNPILVVEAPIFFTLIKLFLIMKACFSSRYKPTLIIQALSQDRIRPLNSRSSLILRTKTLNPKPLLRCASDQALVRLLCLSTAYVHESCGLSLYELPRGHDTSQTAGRKDPRSRSLKGVPRKYPLVVVVRVPK